MHTVSYEETHYVIAHNGADIVHPTIVEPGVTLSTGQPNLEEFTDKAAWEGRIRELGQEPPMELPSFDLKPGERPTAEQLESLRAAQPPSPAP